MNRDQIKKRERELIKEWTHLKKKKRKESREKEETFVLHSPLEFDNDRLPGQIVQEWLWVNWYCLMKFFKLMT